jgi:hypothetical protein
MAHGVINVDDPLVLANSLLGVRISLDNSDMMTAKIVFIEIFFTWMDIQDQEFHPSEKYDSHIPF